jgi:hypothetical protein
MNAVLSAFTFLKPFFHRSLREREQQEAREKQLAHMNSITDLNQLVEFGYMTEKDAHMVAELQKVVTDDYQKSNQLGNYRLWEKDPLLLIATFAGGKPNCWPSYHKFNLRHDSERSKFEWELYRTLARSVVFHATAENPASIYKSTRENFAAVDLEPELTFLKIFDRYEGHLSNG